MLLAIELVDELIYSSREAAWPLIRTDLRLSYLQIGLLLSIPNVVGNLIEMALGILADTWNRRRLILAGGISYALSALLRGVSLTFSAYFGAETLSSPSSGAFVSLSQAALMDRDPSRHEQNMARWTLAGSLGVVAGPLLLGAAVAIGFGWRGLFIAIAGITTLLVLVAWRLPGLGKASAGGESDMPKAGSFWNGLAAALGALRNWEVTRWLVLLEFSDLMLDVLYGYLALYFVDVVGLSPVVAGLAVAVWSGVGLAGDFLLVPLLERVRGLAYLRISIWIELALYPAFLLAPWLPVKLVLVGLLGFFNSGWYSILQGRLYSSLPGRSGTVITLNNVFGIAGRFIPLGIGFAAERLGLGAAMWLLLAGPLVLLFGLPRE